MQASTPVQIRQRIEWQIAVLAAVAALGIAVGFGLGTWVADDSPSSGLVTVATSDRSGQIIDMKFAQMDAQDSRFSTGVSSALVTIGTTDRSDHIIDVKFAQMDAQDARTAAAPVAVAGVSEGPSANSIIDMKFAQMDAADSRFGSATSSGLVTISTTDRSDQIIDVKFAQMDAEDAH